MIPIWYYAGKRLSAELKSRQVPLLAMAAAFSFVIMMFNLPIPGGSTGHAVGGAIIAIVIGPWAVSHSYLCGSCASGINVRRWRESQLSPPTALTWQLRCLSAPITSINSLVASSGITSSRRVIAAAVAGYISLTFAAALTGFEFGIQPLLHIGANGLPLYMPYPLSVAMPAMVLEHVLGFGFVEAIVTALIFAYIQKTDTSILFGAKSRRRIGRVNKPATA